ncbi:hypothetical protein M4D50_01125 [Rothia sp. p3-SID1597]|nr:hypothetical protein [Rothia sp. p3-SID1597]
MTNKQKTVEQILRDNGWEVVKRNECRKDDTIFDLEEQRVYEVECPASDGCYWLVLRAPRPEPEYDEGTVATITYPNGPKIGAIWDAEFMNWVALYDQVCQLDASKGDVHVVLYPDGSTPEPGPVTDEQVLAAINVHLGHVGSKAQHSLEGLFPKTVENWRATLEAARLAPVKAEEEITLEKIRETGKVAVDRDGDKWHWSRRADNFANWGTVNPEGCWADVSDLIAATAPGYFTHWANEEAGE